MIPDMEAARLLQLYGYDLTIEISKCHFRWILFVKPVAKGQFRCRWKGIRLHLPVIGIAKNLVIVNSLLFLKLLLVWFANIFHVFVQTFLNDVGL